LEPSFVLAIRTLSGAASACRRAGEVRSFADHFVRSLARAGAIADHMAALAADRHSVAAAGLAEYPGTVLLVSHDRDFLDRVVTSVIATEGDGCWIEYAGGYTDMLAQRKPAGRRTLPSRVSGAKRPRPVTEIRAQPPARPRRISFNNRRALEMLPARIAELQTQITGLNAVLADPDLYAVSDQRCPARFQRRDSRRDRRHNRSRSVGLILPSHINHPGGCYTATARPQ
jgi:hypothetical protein